VRLRLFVSNSFHKHPGTAKKTLKLLKVARSNRRLCFVPAEPISINCDSERSFRVPIPWSNLFQQSVFLVMLATMDLDFSRVLKEGAKENRAVRLREELFRMRFLSPNFCSAELGT